MKKFILEATGLLIVIAIGIFLYMQGQNVNLPFLPEQPVFKQLTINGVQLKVEIADTQAKRSKGLGGRQGLGQDEGMLFIFPKEDKHPFWMKGLTFPLDFVWIRDNKVVDVLRNIQPSAAGQPDAALPIYQSSESVDKVLEVSAGTIDRLKIRVGDAVTITQ